MNLSTLLQYVDVLTWIIGGVLIGFVIIMLLLGSGSFPYTAQTSLFTKAEQVFLRTLERSVSNTPYRVYGKVRIADLLKVSAKPNSRQFWHWFRQISSKHVDYVLVERNTFKPVAVLELDDASHQRKDRSKRDVFVNKAFESAGIPIIRVPWSKQCSADALRQQIEQATHSDGQRAA
jgi:hypothetical protein